jgi:hypothetical protein
MQNKQIEVKNQELAKTNNALLEILIQKGLLTSEDAETLAAEKKAT